MTLSNHRLELASIWKIVKKFASSSSHNLPNWASRGITKIVNDPGLVKTIYWIFILKPWLQPVLSCNFCLVCPAPPPLLHLTIALCHTLLWLLHTLLPIAHSSNYCKYCALICLLHTLLVITHTSPSESFFASVSKVRAMHALTPLIFCSLADTVTQQHINTLISESWRCV